MSSQYIPSLQQDDSNSNAIQWVTNEIQKEIRNNSRKRRRSSTNVEILLQQAEPPEKTVKLQQEQHTSGPNIKEILLAYTRIWNNLDLTKPMDASLEPFIWSKIKEYRNQQR